MTKLRALIKQNQWFFASFYLFLIIGALLLWWYPSGEFLRVINREQTWFGDVFFAWITRMGEEIPYIVCTVLLFLHKPRIGMLIPATGLMVSILAFFSKWYFAHPRPATFFQEQGIINLIQPVEGIAMHTGLSSFPSGHTFSAFALYTLLALLVSQKKVIGVLFFLLAFLVGFSRIYLVQHFLKDVYAGAILGVMLGIIIYQVQLRWAGNSEKWYNKSIVSFL